MKKNHLLLVTANSIGAIATIIINALAVILPLNGKSTNELSDALPNLFVPAGITFSIWSVIYLFLIIFILYQIIGIINKQSDLTYLEKIGGWFFLGSLANIAWIFLWHWEWVPLSLGAMVVLLISLLVMYLKLDIGVSSVSYKEKLAVHTTISIYLGWITVATIANVTAVLVYFGVGELFLGQEVWTILVLAIVALLTATIILKRKDLAYSLVIIWALLGIVIKRLTDDPLYGVKTEIAIAATVAIVIIAAVFVITLLVTQRKKGRVT